MNRAQRVAFACLGPYWEPKLTREKLPKLKDLEDLIEQLETVVMRLYSIHKRRHDLWSITPDRNEDFHDCFFNKFIQVYDNADLEKLSAEGLACSFALSKVFDKDLKLKLMEEKGELDIKKLKMICEKHKITSNDASLGLGDDKKKGMHVSTETAGIKCWKCKGSHTAANCKLTKEELVCEICESKGRQMNNHTTIAHRTPEQMQASKKEWEAAKK